MKNVILWTLRLYSFSSCLTCSRNHYGRLWMRAHLGKMSQVSRVNVNISILQSWSPSYTYIWTSSAGGRLASATTSSRWKKRKNFSTWKCLARFFNCWTGLKFSMFLPSHRCLAHTNRRENGHLLPSNSVLLFLS